MFIPPPQLLTALALTHMAFWHRQRNFHGILPCVSKESLHKCQGTNQPHTPGIESTIPFIHWSATKLNVERIIAKACCFYGGVREERWQKKKKLEWGIIYIV